MAGKWDPEIVDTPEDGCHKAGTTKCHCFGYTFIELYRQHVGETIANRNCAKKGCGEAATGGAHLDFGNGLVLILPMCSSCNTPRATDCFEISRSTHPKALRLYCCCFNTRNANCCCNECMGVNCNTCKCRTSGEWMCTCSE